MNLESGKGALNGRVSLITGGGTGIGRGIALAFAREGAAVAITGRRKEPLDEVVNQITAMGAKAIAIIGDVISAEHCQRMVTDCAQRLGALHILVNNAGVARFGALEQTSDEDIENMLNVNLRGVVYMSKYALPELQNHSTGAGACILNIGTSAALTPVKNFSVYTASKGALSEFTQCLALDVAEHRVRVNCIHPGVVETPIFETMMPKAAVKSAMSTFAKQTPLGRVGTPDDIAEAALYLCSQKAEWITGASLTVDGGISLT
jgi:NAD(P)-dependent dehydrogenase (short-subunit alcohol dehydrogenase family)